MTLDERLMHIENHSSRHVNFLAQCYEQNSWSYREKMNLPFVERLEKLEALVTTHHSNDAMLSVISHYLPEVFPTPRIKEVPEAAIQELLQKPREERFDYILNLAIQGSQWVQIRHRLRDTPNRQLAEVLDLMVRHLEALDSTN